MIIGEVLGFWFVVGMAFAGWRRFRNDKGSRVARVIPPSNERRS